MASSGSVHKIFVGSAPGIEALLTEELRETLGEADPKPQQGGVGFSGNNQRLWEAAHRLRIAESVRVRLTRFRATDFDSLTQGLGRLPWAAYYPRDSAPGVRALCRKSRLYHTGAVEERAAEAIRTRLAHSRRQRKKAGLPVPAPPPQPTEQEGEAPTIFVRIVRDWAEVSVDAIGEPRLHRRGYREHVGKAPIRETLAAACLRAAGLEPDQVVWDPFCGSGTLALEWASMRLGRAAAIDRPYAFQRWPTHDAEAYGSFLDGLRNEATAPEAPLAYGSDIDKKEIAAAEHNRGKAGLEAAVELQVGDFTDAETMAPAGCALVTNLPYGKRTSARELTRTFERLGTLLRKRTDIDSVHLLAHGRRPIEAATALRFDPILRFKNRGLDVVLLRLKRRPRPTG